MAVHTLCVDTIGRQVWKRIDDELARRKTQHLHLNSWARLGDAVELKAQRMTNWKTRGVPASMHAAIADALGWTVDRLVGRDDAVDRSAPAATLAPSDLTPAEVELVLNFRGRVATAAAAQTKSLELTRNTTKRIVKTLVQSVRGDQATLKQEKAKKKTVSSGRARASKSREHTPDP